MARWFGAGLRGMATVPNTQRLELDALRGRLLSSSYAPVPGHPNHAPMLRKLRELFERHQQAGHVDWYYQTRLFYGRLRPA